MYLERCIHVDKQRGAKGGKLVHNGNWLDDIYSQTRKEQSVLLSKKVLPLLKFHNAKSLYRYACTKYQIWMYVQLAKVVFITFSVPLLNYCQLWE